MNTPLTLKRKKPLGDRFIPKAICSNLYDLYFAEDKQEAEKQRKDSSNQRSEGFDNNSENYISLLQSHLLGCETATIKKGTFQRTKTKKKKKLMRFGHEDRAKTLEETILKRLDDGLETTYKKAETNYRRKISKHPCKILDAPGLQDDYYLNLMDWSRKNQLAIGLDNLVYLWSASNSKVSRLCEYPEDKICSVSWSDSGRHTAVGITSGEVEVFDSVKMKPVRIFEGHSGRVGSLDWNGYILASGSRDRSILLRDVREPRDYFAEFHVRKNQKIEPKNQKF